MKDTEVYLEIKGQNFLAGKITGNDYKDACFCYSKDFLAIEGIKPISISLPLREESFTREETANYFEGLLPEGFSRRSVASWAKVDEKDYLSILECLGRECLGAIRIGRAPTSVSFYDFLSRDRVKELATEGATYSTQLMVKTHLSLTGASGKVGLYYDEKADQWYLPSGLAPSNYIVKQSHVRYENMVINEQICMLTAKYLGIDVPKTFIVNTGTGGDEDVLFATKRYDRLLSDRTLGGLKVPYRLHQEDFAQALGISAFDKYEKTPKGYLAGMFRLIGNVSGNPIEDQIKLWDRVVFNYLIGNTDCHIKNYSLVYDADLRGIRLAPAYDIVCTRVYDLTDEMSYFIGDRINIGEITRKDFEQAASEIGMGRKMAIRRFDSMADRLENALEKAVNEVAEHGFLQALQMGDRIREKLALKE